LNNVWGSKHKINVVPHGFLCLNLSPVDESPAD